MSGNNNFLGSKMSQKTAIITGAAKRVGRAIALHLAGEGYNIALHYNRSAEAAKQTQQEIQQQGVRCHLFQADLSQQSQYVALIENIAEAFDSVDVLINSASTFARKPLAETTPDFFHTHFTINFIAPYFLIQHFARFCQTGQVINLLDTMIKTYPKKFSVYILAKKSLAELTQLAAKELAPNIRVNGIAPGHVLPPANSDEVYVNKVIEKTLIKKLGSPRAVVQAVDFFLKNEFVTGEIVHVDGGYQLSR